MAKITQTVISFRVNFHFANFVIVNVVKDKFEIY